MSIVDILTYPYSFTFFRAILLLFILYCKGTSSAPIAKGRFIFAYIILLFHLYIYSYWSYFLHP